jgi:hypothetical protein
MKKLAKPATGFGFAFAVTALSLTSGCGVPAPLEPMQASVPDGRGGKKLVDTDLCVSPGKLASNVFARCQPVRDERSGEVLSVKTEGFAATPSEGGALASTVIGTAEAAGSLMYGVGAIKQAFSPAKIPQDQSGASTTFSFSQAASGAVALQSTVVPTRGGGGTQINKTDIGSIKNSSVDVLQSNFAGLNLQ